MPDIEVNRRDRDSLDEILCAFGVNATEGLLQALDEFVKERAAGRAGEMLIHLVRKLPPSADAVTLEFVLAPTGQSLRKCAARAGISHPALIKRIAKLKRNLVTNRALL